MEEVCAPDAGDKQQGRLVGQRLLERGCLAHAKVEHGQLGLVLQQAEHRQRRRLALGTPAIGFCLGF